MAEEKKFEAEPEDTNKDPEYVKPNPQDNPRNISLNEIAKAQAERHKADASETLPSIDEEGNVTEAPATEVPTEPEAPPAETETPAEPQVEPEKPAPIEAKSDDAIDPKKLYKVKVDGQEMEVPGQKIIDAGFRTFQKETAADYRLSVATNLLQEAERRAAAVPQRKEEPEQQGPNESDIAKDIQFGTPEQAAAAIKVLQSRGLNQDQVTRFVMQQSRQAARDELNFQDALKTFKAEYPDLIANDYLKRLVFSEEARYRAPKENGGLGDTRPYEAVYKEIGDNLRKSLNLPKPTATQTETPSTATAKGRQAVKAEKPPVPRTAASRLSEGEAKGKAPTPSEIIAGMAAKRGQHRLTNVRKE